MHAVSQSPAMKNGRCRMHGGKSLGAPRGHHRSVIFRRAYVDLRGVEERLIEIRGTRDGYNAADMVLRIPSLAAQLGAATWRLRGDRILIESKDEIKKRLGMSPDDADAIVLAWHKRDHVVWPKSAWESGSCKWVV